MKQSKITSRNARHASTSRASVNATSGAPASPPGPEVGASDTTSDFRALGSTCPDFPIPQWRAHPLLIGRFLSDDVHARIHLDSPRDFNLTRIQDDGFEGLAITLQAGPDMVCWIADLTSAALWHNLHAWHAAHVATLAPCCERDGQFKPIPMEFGLAPELLALEPELKGRTDLAQMFYAKASQAIAESEFARMLNSTLPEYPQLRSVSCSIVVD